MEPVAGTEDTVGNVQTTSAADNAQVTDAENADSHTLLIWLIVLVCIAAVAAAGVTIVVKRKEEKN